MGLEMTGEYQLTASRDEVYAALNDEAVLKHCIPGCETIERTADDKLSAVVVAKVGPIRARFTGTVTLSDREPPSRYRISGEGNGGVAGAASGGAFVILSEVDGGTHLSYQVEVQIRGKLAQLGQRLIVSTAKKNVDAFFESFVQLLDGGGTPESTKA